jgi:bifunctional ADP-heptose synthase (sugar kinase/adenylyltransferase)/phosphoglycolate phosphatase-like HAD superfamily hydrolase
MFKTLYPTQSEITDVMKRLPGARVGVLGDYCIDAYWELDSSIPEISIETGKQVQHVKAERYSPGGAGNVVVNLRALGVKHIMAFAIIGDDLYGREMARGLTELGVDTTGLIVQRTGWATPVYGKPLLDDVEQQRLDFGLFNVMMNETFHLLTKCLCENKDEIDFLIVNQQIPHGWCSVEHAEWMSMELRTHWAGRHIVDARHFVRYFAGNALKVNQREAAHVLALPQPERHFSDDEALDLLRGLTRNSDEVQFVTRGEYGILAGEVNTEFIIPGVAITGPTDTVGAGDAATAMLAACRAIRLDPRSSATMANLAAAITVQKINQTGTASESELVDAARRLSYVHHPTLADEPRRAQLCAGTDVEIVTGSFYTSVMAEPFPYQYAVFDHDGTISTLRQGWELVMEPVMVRAILGSRYNSMDSVLFQKVTHRVRQFIEQSTGIQTIAQMDGLVRMVTEFGIAPADEQCDAWGYKQTYNDALMAMVNDRIERLERGELNLDDFIMKGAVAFLKELRARDVKLFLVSGTDEVDAIREAGLLGYASLFDQGIFGAKPGSRADTKGEIINSLLDTIGKNSTAGDSGLLVIGDGPVEIRLGSRYGATSLGIASNEEHRFGLNTTKRRRLIRAGAHLITPDFSQWRSLLDLLHGFRVSAQAGPLQ